MISSAVKPTGQVALDHFFTLLREPWSVHVYDGTLTPILQGLLRDTEATPPSFPQPEPGPCKAVHQNLCNESMMHAQWNGHRDC